MSTGGGGSEDFSTGAELSLTVSDRELNALRSQIERELADIPIGLDASGIGGRGRMQPRDPSSGRFMSIEGVEQRIIDQTDEQVELLRNIQSELGSEGGGTTELAMLEIQRRNLQWQKVSAEEDIEAGELMETQVEILDDIKDAVEGGGGGGDGLGFGGAALAGRIGAGGTGLLSSLAALGGGRAFFPGLFGRGGSQPLDERGVPTNLPDWMDPDTPLIEQIDFESPEWFDNLPDWWNDEPRVTEEERRQVDRIATGGTTIPETQRRLEDPDFDTSIRGFPGFTGDTINGIPRSILEPTGSDPRGRTQEELQQSVTVDSTVTVEQSVDDQRIQEAERKADEAVSTVEEWVTENERRLERAFVR